MSCLRPITQEDIRKGDMIRVTYLYPKTGTTIVRDGRVTHYDVRGWSDADGMPIYSLMISSDAAVTIHLIDRPRPKLPTEPGSVILATKIKDYTIRPAGIHASRRYDGKWQSLTFSDVFSEAEIEDWKPVKLVPNENAEVVE